MLMNPTIDFGWLSDLVGRFCCNDTQKRSPVMSTHHYQCQYCYCTTSMWEDDDGKDDFYGGPIEDCGCQSAVNDDYDDDD